MTNQRILIVDDEPNVSGLVRLYLEKTQRFDVRVENRPALGLFAARAFRPDLILLDVNMPGKDGGEVAREIEADPSLHAVPIIFFTSLISHTEAEAGLTAWGGHRFLAKPVSAAVLIAAVDGVLNGEAQPA